MLIKMICPRCGASLEIDDRQEIMTCKYCGYQQANLSEKVEVTHKIDRSNDPNLYISFNTSNPSVQMVTRIVSTGQKNTYVNGQSMSFHLPAGRHEIILKIGKKNYSRTIVIPEDNQPVRISASFSGRANIGIDQPNYGTAGGKAVPLNAKKKQSVFGIIGFILSLTMYLSPIGLALGILDLVRSKKDPDHSHGLGIAAVIIGAVLSIALISVGASSCGKSTKGGSMEPETETAATAAVKAETDAPEDNQNDLSEAKADHESAKDELSSAAEDLKNEIGEIFDVFDESSESEDAASDEEGAKADPETAGAETKEAYQVGDEISDGGFRIVYMASGDYQSDNEFIQPEEGNKFIFLKFAFINESSSEKNISYFDFDCYADGYLCDASYFGEEGLSANLTSGRATEGYIYFEVPQNASDIEIEYNADVWTDRKVKFKFEGNQDSGYVLEKSTERSEGAHAVGEVIEGNHVNITYLSCEETTSDNMFIQPRAGYHFVTLTLEFENTGSSDHTASSMYFDCYADGIACSQNYFLENDLSGTISAGRKLQGTVTFEVPNDAAVIEAEYNDSFWTSNRIVFTVK